MIKISPASDQSCIIVEFHFLCARNIRYSRSDCKNEMGYNKLWVSKLWIPWLTVEYFLLFLNQKKSLPGNQSDTSSIPTFSDIRSLSSRNIGTPSLLLMIMVFISEIMSRYFVTPTLHDESAARNLHRIWSNSLPYLIWSHIALVLRSRKILSIFSYSLISI